MIMGGYPVGREFRKLVGWAASSRPGEFDGGGATLSR
jgi:hypothetical protein